MKYLIKMGNVWFAGMDTYTRPLTTPNINEAQTFDRKDVVDDLSSTIGNAKVVEVPNETR